MHGSVWQLLGATKQTKNRARLLLATSQCRLACTLKPQIAYVYYLAYSGGLRVEGARVKVENGASDDVNILSQP